MMEERSWLKQQPSRCIKISNLPVGLHERELSQILTRTHAQFDDVRILPKTGPRGESDALVEFPNKKSAADWMDSLRGDIYLRTGCRSLLTFTDILEDVLTPWTCKCGSKTSGQMRHCFKCGRHANDQALSDDRDRVSPHVPSPPHRNDIVRQVDNYLDMYAKDIRNPKTARDDRSYDYEPRGVRPPKMEDDRYDKRSTVDPYDKRSTIDPYDKRSTVDPYERDLRFEHADRASRRELNSSNDRSISQVDRDQLVHDRGQTLSDWEKKPDMLEREERRYMDLHPDHSSNPYCRDQHSVRDTIRSHGIGEDSQYSVRRPTAQTDDGSDQVGPNPCNTVLLRGLDGLSDEKRILAALAKITSLEPTNCYVMRNLITNISLGFGFMEFDTVANAKRIVEYFNSEEPFEVDGKLILIDFAKNTYKTIMAGISMAKEQYSAATKSKAEEERKAKLQAQEAARKKLAQDQLLRLQKEAKEKAAVATTKMTSKELELFNAQQKAKEAMEKGKVKTISNDRKSQPVKNNDNADTGKDKMPRETYTGYQYDNETGLYIDRGKFIPERYAFIGHSMSNSLDLRIFDQNEIVPNGRLEDLITAAVKLLDGKALKGRLICCYIFFGVTDLVDVKQMEGYREVVLRESGDKLLISKLDWAVGTMKEKGILPVFCTFPPMSFAKHNQFLMKNGLTGQLNHKAKYQEMQTKLNTMVACVNSRIEELNCKAGVITCQLAAKIFSQERGKYVLRDAYLKDGLHLTSQGATLLNLELAQNLRKTKQGKRSPDWLKKSHQVKSTGSISFSIKKKEEDKVPTNPSVIESNSISVKNSEEREAQYEFRRNDRGYQQLNTLEKSSNTKERQSSHRSRSPSRHDYGRKLHGARNQHSRTPERIDSREHYRESKYQEDLTRRRRSRSPYNRSSFGQPKHGDQRSPAPRRKSRFDDANSKSRRDNSQDSSSWRNEDRFQSGILPTPSLLGDKPSSLLGAGPGNGQRNQWISEDSERKLSTLNALAQLQDNPAFNHALQLQRNSVNQVSQSTSDSILAMLQQQALNMSNQRSYNNDNWNKKKFSTSTGFW